MPHTLFIADLHLDESHPTTVNQFFYWIDHCLTATVDAIYVLGDFFEVWVGDDDCSPFYQRIKQAFKSLTDRHIAVYFIHGNRDFLIGKRFERETGCKILPEHSVVTVYNSTVLLLHGDALCTQDIKHMKFRKIFQNFWLRKLFLALPLKVRKKIGISLRQKSRQHHQYVASQSLAVNKSAVEITLEQSGANCLIHGHIHEASYSNFFLNNQPCERIVLGAWDSQGCMLKWHASGKREMEFFSNYLAQSFG